jgi:hypothetical protein
MKKFGIFLESDDSANMKKIMKHHEKRQPKRLAELIKDLGP